MYHTVSRPEIHDFMKRTMVAIGTNLKHAETLADVLVTGDYRGHFSHGLNRLDLYMKDIQAESCQKDGEPTIINQTVATACVDGHNLLGPVIGKFCMELAIKKAKDAGVGWVVCRGKISSVHFFIKLFSHQSLCFL